MKKIALSFAFIVLCFSCVIFTACSDKSSVKASTFSSEQKENCIEKAQNVITFFNEKKSDEIREMSNETLRNVLSDDMLSEAYSQLGVNGEFEKFLENDMTETDQNGQSYIVVVQQAKYQKNILTYTVSFDKDDKLAGIYYK